MANIVHKQVLAADVPTPPAGYVTLFSDLTDGTPKYKDELGDVYDYGAAGSIYYKHTQAVASTSWVINHNQGVEPNVQVFDGAGEVMIPQITHLSINTTQIDFTTATAGFAVFS